MSTRNEKPTEPFSAFMVRSLRSKKEAKSYLEHVLETYHEDGDMPVLLSSLRHIAEAQGGLQNLAKETGLNRQSLYRMLSPRGNPGLKSMLAIIHSLGYRIRLEPIRYKTQLA